MKEIQGSFVEYFYRLVQQIPRGRVSSYGALARALGDIRAARAVGTMLNQNPRPIEVPCHRVVMSDGSIGGFGMGVDKKVELLEDEGVHVHDGVVDDFEEILFEGFQGPRPLIDIREEQVELKGDVVSKDAHGEIETICGVDVSYGDDRAYGAMTVWDEGEKIHESVVCDEITFPYIPSYLSYRELPVLVKLIKKFGEPDLVMVDGNGTLHPRGLGLASHLGVVMDIPTMGVAKSLLLGSLKETIDHDNISSPVILEGDVKGYALLSSSRAKNPIYISAGHRVSHETAIDIVKENCTYKIPEPIRQAHILATKARKGDER